MFNDKLIIISDFNKPNYFDFPHLMNNIQNETKINKLFLNNKNLVTNS